MQRLFKYLVLATCILLLRVDALDNAVDSGHATVQSTHDTLERASVLFSPGLPAEEEAELEQDGLYEAPCVCDRVQGLDLRAKFSVLGHENSCSRAAMAGHPHLRL